MTQSDKTEKGLPETLKQLQDSEYSCWIWDIRTQNALVWANHKGMNFWQVSDRPMLRQILFPQGHPLVDIAQQNYTMLTQNKQDIVHNQAIIPFLEQKIMLELKTSLHPLPDNRIGLLMQVMNEDIVSNPQEEQFIEEKQFANFAQQPDEPPITTMNTTAETTYTQNFNDLPIAIIVTDEHGRITFINDNAQQFSGLKNGEMLCNYLTDPLEKDIFLRTLQDQQTQDLSVHMRLHEHNMVVKISLQPHPDTKEYHLVLTDKCSIEDRQEDLNIHQSLDLSTDDAEQQTANSHDKSLTLRALDQAGMGVFSLTEDGYIKSCSPAAELLLCQDVQKLLDKPFIDLFHPDMQSTLNLYFQNNKDSTHQTICQQLRKGVETICLLPDTRMLEVSLSLRPAREQSGYWAILRDIGEFKKLLQDMHSIRKTFREMQQDTPQESTEPTKDTATDDNSVALSTILHDLRTPLNAILGFSELISLRLEQETTGEDCLTYAKHIQSGGQYMLTLINNLSLYQNLLHGQIEPNLQPLSLEPFINETAALLKPLANEKQIELTAFILKDCPMIIADRHMLKQSVINLVTNAIHASKAGSMVSLIAGPTRSQKVMIEIKDEGCGIPQDKLETILQPFQRLDSQKYQGSGLGLTIAHSLINAHPDAKFLIDSIVNQGTRIRLIFSPQT